MNEITTIVNTTMSSREIAELTGKQHQHVKRDIRNMLEALKKDVSTFGRIYKDASGREQEEYALDHELTMTLVSGYDIPLRHRVITRWQQLEAQLTKPIDPMQFLNDPASMRGLLLTYTEKVLTLESQVADLSPKAAALDRISTSDGAMCITNAAKDLQIRPKDLFAWLSANRWIYKRAGGSGWTAYQDRIKVGYLQHKVTTVERSDGTEKTVEQVLVTSKGLAKLANAIVGFGEVA